MDLEGNIINSKEDGRSHDGNVPNGDDDELVLQNASQQEKLLEMKASLDKKDTIIRNLEREKVVLKQNIQDEKDLHKKTKELSEKRIKMLTKVNAELRLMQESDKRAHDRLKELYEEAKEELNSQRHRMLDLTADLEAEYTSASEQCHDINNTA